MKSRQDIKQLITKICMLGFFLTSMESLAVDLPTHQATQKAKNFCQNLFALDFPKSQFSSGKANPFTLSLPGLSSYIKSNARPFDIATLIPPDVPVIYFGETHSDKSPKNMLAQNMQKLKQAGITYIGMEMFNSSKQGILDSYFEGKISSQVVLQLLVDEWGWLPDDYMKVVDSARAARIRIIGLDARDLAKSATVHFRDQHMAEVLAKVVRADPHAKIGVLEGSVHAQCKGAGCRNELPSQPDILLEEKGFRSVSYLIDFLVYQSPIRKAVEAAGLPTDNLFLPVPKEDASYDGYIFIDSYREKTF